MNDDNKTNKELLEEVKKLRQLEEDKKKSKEREDAIVGGCSLIIFIPFLIILFNLCY